MRDTASTRWVIRGIPAVALVLTAVGVAFAGLVFIFIGVGLAPTNAPGSETYPLGVVLGVALVVAGGPALAWLARGVWRARPWATHIALLFSVAAMAFCAWVAIGAFTPTDWALNQTTGRLEPQYSAVPIALAFIPYAIVFACLVVAELRRHPA